jgi:tripartite-type tricarboxylate transporter receptor subunit TctC
MGAEPLPMTPEQFDRYIVEQVAVIARLVKSANIKIE